MSVIIFFSASKNNLFCRNDVQAIDFLRKGSYAPGETVGSFLCNAPHNSELLRGVMIDKF